MSVFIDSVPMVSTGSILTGPILRRSSSKIHIFTCALFGIWAFPCEFATDFPWSHDELSRKKKFCQMGVCTFVMFPCEESRSEVCRRNKSSQASMFLGTFSGLESCRRASKSRLSSGNDSIARPPELMK